MPAAYPTKLRRQAVKSFLRGDGIADEVGVVFGVSGSAVSRWVKHFREYGTYEPRPRGGGSFSRVQISRLLTVLDAFTDATTDEITRVYNYELPKKERVHRSSILRALKREGFVFKKNGRGLQNKTVPTSQPIEKDSNNG